MSTRPPPLGSAPSAPMKAPLEGQLAPEAQAPSAHSHDSRPEQAASQASQLQLIVGEAPAPAPRPGAYRPRRRPSQTRLAALRETHLWEGP